MTIRKRVFVLLLALAICMSAVGLAEGAARTVNLALDTATDAELAEAAEMIRAEQKARLKTTVQMDPSEVSINKGASQKVTATVLDLPEGVTAGKFVWSSSDESVATCANGTIKGAGAGNAVITCSTTLSDGTEISGEIKVTGLLPVTAIKLANSKIEVMAGDSFDPGITIEPADASNQKVSFASSDEKVVSVDENGNLKAGLAGKATVVITAEDGSKKNAKLSVSVTKRVGRFDDELTFLGLEWGIDDETAYTKLQENGFVKAGDLRKAYNTSSIRYWPRDDRLFARWSSWSELPVSFRDQEKGAANSYLEPLKKVGGYGPQRAELYYLNPVGPDGQVDVNKKELVGVYFSFDNQHERGAEIFVDLLSQLEAQYGEFTRTLARDLTRSYYKDLYSIIKKPMEGARQYRYHERDLGKDLYLSDYAICTLRGKNNTGIALLMDSSENVELFYCKTDTLDRIEEIQKALEAIPDDRENTGI